jgi:hypothetical protein
MPERTTMGLLGDRLIADYYGVRIEVEGNATGLGARFRLIIGDDKADEATCNAGNSISLRGRVKQGESEKPVVVEVKQGWFGTKFRLLVDGKEHPIQKVN